jgi:hypothetical protein
LVVLWLAIGMQAEDTAICSNATLHGSYGLHATGTVIGVGDLQQWGASPSTGREISPQSFS